MINEHYIKGVCFEFADKNEVLSREELENLKAECEKKGDMTEFNEEKKVFDYYLSGCYLDEFIKRRDIFQRWRDCGVNTMFLHVVMELDLRTEEHVRCQSFCSIDADNSEEYYLSLLFDICHEYGISPGIKLMIKDNMTLDFVNNHKFSFFEEYKNGIRYLLNCDSKKYISTILIANETNLIRHYAGLKSYWKDVIDTIHAEYPYVKVSASQFCSDMTSGQYDIADILDFVGINRYPKDSSWPDTPSVEEMLPVMYNDDDIFNTQEFCKNNNKKFVITECGVSHWSGQCREPELGGSMHDFFGKGYDFEMQANYIKASLIASSQMDYCIGHIILCGYDYDPIYLFSNKNALKEVLIDKTLGFEGIKSVWGEKNNG